MTAKWNGVKWVPDPPDPSWDPNADEECERVGGPLPCCGGCTYCCYCLDNAEY